MTADEKAQLRQIATSGPPKRARSLLPSDPPDASATHAELMAWLTVVFSLGGDPVAGVTRYGRHNDARLVVLLRSGMRIVWDRQVDIFNADALVQRVVLTTTADTPPYAKGDAQRIARVLVRAAEIVEQSDDLAESRDWARAFLEAAHHIDEVHDMTTAAGKYAGLCALRDWRLVEVHPHTPAAERAAVLHDTDGRQFVRASAFAAHVRGMASRPVAWAALHGRMSEIGWDGPFELEQRQPSGRAKVKLHAYVVPAGWEEA